MPFILRLFATTIIKRLISELIDSFGESKDVKKPEELDSFLAEARARRLLMSIQRRKHAKR